MRSSTTSTGGFTLIEILVSLSLMGLIATILLASLGVGGETWRRVTRGAEATQDMADAQNFLRTRLESVYPDPVPSSTGVAQLKSDGASLEFVAPGVAAQGGQLSHYHLGLNEKAHTLDVDVRPLGSLESGSGAQTEPLLGEVKDVQFSFWGSPEGTAASGWVHSWNQETLPQLIRLEVSFEARSKHRFPALIVAPRLNATVDCEFDVVSRLCRKASS